MSLLKGRLCCKSITENMWKNLLRKGEDTSKDPGSEVNASSPFRSRVTNFQHIVLLVPTLCSETLSYEKMNEFNMHTAQFSISNEETGSENFLPIRSHSAVILMCFMCMNESETIWIEFLLKILSLVHKEKEHWA